MSDKTVQVRPVQPADEPALTALVASTLGECLGTVLPEHELDACVREYLAHGDDRTWYVADADGELAGYAVAACGTSQCGPVERLYVRHAHTPADVDQDEREIAQALVTALCQSKGDREVAITTATDGGDTALELYDRWGFVDVDALRRCLSMPSGHGRLMGIMQSF